MVECNDNIIDIGCDHGLLDIYLTTNKYCNCIAADISKNVLKITKQNIDKYSLNNKIKLVCSDGLKNINVKKNDKIIISGMGTSTILNILNTKKLDIIDSLIVQSNNEINILRHKVCKLGFYIYDEKVVFDKNKYYVIIFFKKGKKLYTNIDYLFGPIVRKNNINYNYFDNLYKKNKIILDKIPNKHVIKKFKQYCYLKKIKKFTCI